ncbi:MAG: RNA polymerase sigma-54 factor [Omnitrophica WOR_2 bacterium RIFCSPHIGHO2_01_FULL_48_9]|nr:MAG: RNA polymerase sigma-54 factor [Omnitrophica WOR_2 bacterium RIFCSPHIGHO2_01_FULL_48_9]
MKINISTQQVQKQILAPAVQQSIEILLLPLQDLHLTIEQELQSNPLLELDESHPETAKLPWSEKFIQQIKHYEKANSSDYSSQEAGDDLPEESPLKREISLEENLLRQLRIETSNLLELKIGEFIIGNLDEDGYLKLSPTDIAQAFSLTDTVLVERVLQIIHGFEPIGVAACTLQECLLTQAEIKYNGTQPLVSQIIQGYLKEISQKKLTEVAKKLNVSHAEVAEAIKIIAALDPKPARNYRPIDPTIFIKPDVVITKDEDVLEVTVSQEGTPRLRINPLYRAMLNQPHLSEEERNFIREKLKNALQFIKSIEQRGQTLKAITYYILDKQKAFFEQGPKALVPMTLKNIAASLNRNESTISRAISHKYIDTPQGIFPFKFFFSQGIGEEAVNGEICSRSVKEEIKEIVEGENKYSPLSDHDIQMLLEKRGMHVARRTISKYRQVLNILPSHLRKG